MSQFILTYRGDGSTPQADVARIRNKAGVVLLQDADSNSSLLVEAEPATIESLVNSMPAWRAFENRRHKLLTGVRPGAGRKRAAVK